MTTNKVKLGSLMSESERWIKPDPDAIYKQVTAGLWGKGLRQRAEVLGASLSASRLRQVREGDFLISKIDARHGAFGLVPKELEGAVVSNDFPVFEINTHKICPQYLEWFSTTHEFIRRCKNASEGSTNRVRLKTSAFLQMEVPLPGKDQQVNIVNFLQGIRRKKEQYEGWSTEFDNDARNLLMKLFFDIVGRSSYRRMEDVAPLVRRPVETQPDQMYPELGVRSFGNGTFHKASVPGSEIGNKRLFRISEGDLLFNIVFAWEGAVAIARVEDDGRVGSHRFLTCVPKEDIVTSAFLRFFFLTPEGLGKLGDASPGGAGRNRTLGVKKLQDIKVPVPNLEEQRRFNRVSQQVGEIEGIRKAARGETEALMKAATEEVFRKLV